MPNAFKVHVADEVLADLASRLAAVRLPPSAGFSRWEDGTPPEYLQSLVEYWRDKFDWRSQESRLNSFIQFRGDVAGTTLHFIHERGKGPDAMPLLLVHGYPDSIWRFHKLIPLLTDPEAHGGDPADAFDVVAPSLPGYGWSPLSANLTIFDFGNVFGWWPGQPRDSNILIPDIFSAPALPPNQARDQAFENTTPTVVHLDNLDEDAVQRWWDKFRENNRWKTFSQNCSSTVADALNAGGGRQRAPLAPYHLIWTPSDVLEYAQQIQAAGQGQHLPIPPFNPVE